MSLRWRDPRYSWDPADYSGIESATLPFSKFWAPELILHNSVEEKFIYRQVKRRFEKKITIFCVWE